MPQHADVPAETDILCEHCGYGLNGLPTDGLCPECGEPIADSTVADHRTAPAWEAPDVSAWSRFTRTTTSVIASPANFFRHLQTRPAADRSADFASSQHNVSALLLGLTAAIHADTFGLFDFLTDRTGPWLNWALAIVFILAARVALGLITRLASTLTRVEGNYWGYRLPTVAVRRAMNFHSAQLLPVAAIAFLTVAGFRILKAYNIDTHFLHASEDYLFLVCAEVLLAAGYLFRTYWIAMKNIMYANR